MEEYNDSRREVLKKAVYIAPVILTLSAVPTFAVAGSIKGNNGLGNGLDGPPPGDPKPNDLCGDKFGLPPCPQ